MSLIFPVGKARKGLSMRFRLYAIYDLCPDETTGGNWTLLLPDWQWYINDKRKQSSLRDSVWIFLMHVYVHTKWEMRAIKVVFTLYVLVRSS